ncbi:MAG: lysylphosphatidylglycerol synthase transmembrane domain-containing protein [Candidatus Dormibacteria bacterium]
MDRTGSATDGPRSTNGRAISHVGGVSSNIVGISTLPRSLDLGRRVIGHPATRMAVTLIAVAVFIRSVNLSAAIAEFGRLQGQWAVLAMALAGLSVLASIVEWGALLRGAGKRVGWHYLGSWYMKGLFINQIFPAGVGSDAVRGVQVGRVVGHGPVIASLVASRMAGTLGMAGWGLGGAVVISTVFHTQDVVGFALFSGVMLTAWGLALVAEHLFARLRGGNPIGKSWRTHRLTDHFATFLKSLGRYRGAPAALTVSILAGGVGWGLNLLSMEAFSRALGYNISWGVFALALPLALLVTFVPISANGIGIREGVLVFLLVQFHVPIAVAAAMALFVDFQLLPFAAFGGVVHLAETTVKHAYRRMFQVGRLEGPLGLAHATLHWLVAPEAVRELTRG